MSYATINQASNDWALIARVIAAVSKEAYANETLAATEFGAAVRLNPAEGARLVWPVAIDYEADYAYAVGMHNGNPGGDPGVIADAEIQAAVQAHWPLDAEVEP